MINFDNAFLSKCIVHKVGNKYLSQNLILSEESLNLTDDLREQLKYFFLRPFKTISQSYHFYHNIDLKMNDILRCADNIFEDENFIENSLNIVRHLYEETKHPAIKAGELFIALFDDCLIGDAFYKAVGIFKSERKENYFKTNEYSKKVDVSIDNGINQQKLDKACLIVNSNYHLGFDVYSYEHNNADTAYWNDEFLKIKIANDNFNQTSNVLGLYKDFITQEVEKEYEVSKADKIDLLNRSLKYFKENDSFNLESFSTEVIGNSNAISSFLQYKKNFEDRIEMPISDSFDINVAAVKKQSKAYKSVLKLDQNFHIYIHGDKKLIEKGFDEEKSLSYYKVYFKEEN